MTRNNIVMWSSLYKNLLGKCLELFYKSYWDLKTVYYWLGCVIGESVYQLSNTINECQNARRSIARIHRLLYTCIANKQSKPSVQHRSSRLNKRSVTHFMPCILSQPFQLCVVLSLTTIEWCCVMFHEEIGAELRVICFRATINRLLKLRLPSCRTAPVWTARSGQCYRPN